MYVNLGLGLGRELQVNLEFTKILLESRFNDKSLFVLS